jgi:integrase
MLLSKAIELFLGEHKPSTQQAYRAALHLMRDWIGPARELSDVSSALLVEYFQVVVKRKHYAPATEQKHIKSVKTFFNWCVNLELIERSPAKAVRSKKLPRAIDRSKAMSDEELRLLLDSLRYKPRDYALILFLADTGCRRGGAAGLRIQDIDFDKLVAVVTEKGDKSRKVAFGEPTARALRQWLGFRSMHYQIKGVYVFSRDGLPMHAENISIIIRRAARRAGLRVLSSHSLRHRKGHQLADARVAPSLAATALGHSDPMITLTYYYPADWESAEKALRELLTDPAAEPAPEKIIRFKG